MVDGLLKLPVQFSDLEEYVADWALPTEAQRKKKRARSNMNELNDYYGALVDRVRDIATYLSTFPMEELPQPERNLLHMAYMFMEVAVAVEYYKQPEIPGSFPLERFVIEVV